MALIDWIILCGTLLFIVVYGTIRTRGSKDVDDFILGSHQSKWWTVGLSVMATQASAITFLSTPGQAFHDGMGLIQLYFGIPLAMIIICIVFIPIYHRLRVYTAYELLEERFNLRTRTLAAILFLIQRGIGTALTIFAPAIILSSILGWDLKVLVILIGGLVTIYTVSGGTKAVNVTHKQQMLIIMSGMFLAFFLILHYLPADISFNNALQIAGVNNKMEILDFSLDPSHRYTFWNGIFGGLFFSLSYFGTDQSQVGRYLSGESIRESQLGLIFNGIVKIPMQFFILLVGVMVFVFFQFHRTPVNFNPKAVEKVMESPYADQYKAIETQQVILQTEKMALQQQFAAGLNEGKENPVLIQKIKQLNKLDRKNRDKAKELILKADDKQEVNDKDYVFIHFILNYLPKGVIGILLAVILSAAMSSSASGLTALGSTTSMDLYKRFVKSEKSDRHFLDASKWFTVMWGAFSVIFACFASLFENLIQLVNIVGSVFYGNLLGIFLLAFFFRKTKGNAVFVSGIITQLLVFLIYYLYVRTEMISYMLLTVIGAALVMVIAGILNIFMRGPRETIPAAVSEGPVS